MKNKGRVYLVGAGPGDAGLITLKAVSCLQKAEVVIYDRLINPQLLRYVPAGAELIYAGKFPHQHTLSQDKINSLLAAKARQGKTVVRLKCGDPFLFGRGAEEALYLSRQRISFEVIPGVSSALAVPAYAGIPLTHRNYTSSVGIFTGHEDALKDKSSLDWEKLAKGLGTLVFLMGLENLTQITQQLIRCGLPEQTPCALIQEGTLPAQKTITASLGAIAKAAKKAKLRPPALLVVGEVVSLRDRLNWFEKRPLSGKRILITRQDDGNHRLLECLEGYGATCRELPLVSIKPLDNYRLLDSTLKQIDSIEWIVFTSQNAVKFFKQRLNYLGKDVRVLKGIKLAAIGPATKRALENIGLRVELIPSHFCQEGLREYFEKCKLEGKKVVLAGSNIGRDVLAKGLKESAAITSEVALYQTVKSRVKKNELRRCLEESDIVSFTSASAVRIFFALISAKDFKKLAPRPLIAAIGPITSGQVRGFGLKPAIEAKSYTLEALAEAIVEYYQK